MPTNTAGYPLEFAKLLDRYNQDITALMARLESKSITLAAWRKEFDHLLARFAIAARLVGGEASITPASLASLDMWLTEQLKYANGFESVIAAGSVYNSAWLSRAQMYGASTVTQYWEGATGDLPLPAMPGQGTQCLSNCHCRWEIVWIDRKRGDADCYWRLGAAEHCQTCEVRAEEWNPVRVRGGDLQ